MFEEKDFQPFLKKDYLRNLVKMMTNILYVLPIKSVIAAMLIY